MDQCKQAMVTLWMTGVVCVRVRGSRCYFRVTADEIHLLLRLVSAAASHMQGQFAFLRTVYPYT
jgi:hypothetical protein